MDNTFKDDEKLYRAIKPIELYEKENGRIASAAFKRSNGCSVDRGNGRSDEEAKQFLMRGKEGIVCVFYVRDCRSKEIYIRYEPIEENPYHSGLYKNEDRVKMTSSQCRHLASVAKFV